MDTQSIGVYKKGKNLAINPHCSAGFRQTVATLARGRVIKASHIVKSINYKIYNIQKNDTLMINMCSHSRTGAKVIDTTCFLVQANNTNVLENKSLLEVISQSGMSVIVEKINTQQNIYECLLKSFLNENSEPIHSYNENQNPAAMAVAGFYKPYVTPFSHQMGKSIVYCLHKCLAIWNDQYTDTPIEQHLRIDPYTCEIAKKGIDKSETIELITKEESIKVYRILQNQNCKHLFVAMHKDNIIKNLNTFLEEKLTKTEIIALDDTGEKSVLGADYINNLVKKCVTENPLQFYKQYYKFIIANEYEEFEQDINNILDKIKDDITQEDINNIKVTLLGNDFKVNLEKLTNLLCNLELIKTYQLEITKNHEIKYLSPPEIITATDAIIEEINKLYENKIEIDIETDFDKKLDNILRNFVIGYGLVDILNNYSETLTKEHRHCIESLIKKRNQLNTKLNSLLFYNNTENVLSPPNRARFFNSFNLDNTNFQTALELNTQKNNSLVENPSNDKLPSIIQDLKKMLPPLENIDFNQIKEKSFIEFLKYNTNDLIKLLKKTGNLKMEFNKVNRIFSVDEIGFISNPDEQTAIVKITLNDEYAPLKRGYRIISMCHSSYNIFDILNKNVVDAIQDMQLLVKSSIMISLLQKNNQADMSLSLRDFTLTIRDNYTGYDVISLIKYYDSEKKLLNLIDLYNDIMAFDPETPLDDLQNIIFDMNDFLKL